MDVVTAVITAQGACTMTTSAESQTASAASAAGQEQKPEKKASAAPQKPRSASGKAVPGKKPTPAKKTAKTAKKARSAEAGGAREGSKTARVLDLLKRPGGATLKEIMKATGWQPHSVRGFISGTLGKKMGLTVESTKCEDGGRNYSLPK
jgi:transglutaminase/protease-like cytokinesis protein 3